MRKFIFLIVTLFYVTCGFAQTKHVTLTFNAEDFHVCDERNGAVSVVSYIQNVCYSSDTTTACVPYIMVNITIPYDKRYADIQYKSR